ncbi:hypothetical protein ACFYZ9_23925 [Streptomyces sp. NPDC001691]|uniref:hypothetical protein n=1 Tax=Streptomyces sp. NPDC001691 TaxID=3364600 RepID=UPI0036D13A76
MHPLRDADLDDAYDHPPREGDAAAVADNRCRVRATRHTTVADRPRARAVSPPGWRTAVAHPVATVGAGGPR